MEKKHVLKTQICVNSLAQL